MSAVPGGGRASRGDPAGAVPAPVARGPASPSPSAPTPVRKVGDRFRRRRRGRGFAIAFLLINAGPAAAAIWWFTQPESERQRLGTNSMGWMRWYADWDRAHPPAVPAMAPAAPRG